MKLSFVWLMSMLGLLFLANVLMAVGYVNNQAGLFDSFVEEHFLNPAPSLSSGEYEAIGTYDNLTKKPAHGKSDWRGPPPDEPLLNGAGEFQVDEDHLFMFANNQSKPECCGASYSTSTGCVCTTPGQRDLLNKRGGNNNLPAASV
jgi:hypothetical protein